MLFLRSGRQGIFHVYSALSNLLLTTLVLLHNIQISKLSVKKGNYLLDFCKGGNERIQTCSLFSDVHVLCGDKGVKLSEGCLVKRGIRFNTINGCLLQICG